MKKGLKKLLGLGLAVSLALGCNGMTAFAETDEFKDDIVTYYVLTDSNSATASTSYLRPATIETIATVYYFYNNNAYCTQGPKVTASIGGSSSRAVVAHSGGLVVGGKGNHYLTSGNLRWNDDTFIGNTW